MSQFKPRDPRFEETSGHFNSDLFKKSYSFVYEYQEAEINALKKEIASEKDPERKKKLQATLSSMVSFLSCPKAVPLFVIVEK